MGGVAGGDKFIADGVLVKFAVDPELRPGRFLYGGETKSDLRAAKVLYSFSHPQEK